MKIFNYTLALMASTLFANSVLAFQLGKMPKNVEEIIDTSSLIVVGKLENVISKGIFYGYQKNAKSLAKLDKLTPIKLGVPYVDYKLQVESILMKSKKMITTRDGHLVYRVFQSHDVAGFKNKSFNGKTKSIFFLSKAPKGKAYGIRTPMHRLNLNQQGPVTYSKMGKELSLRSKDKGYYLSSHNFLKKIKILLKSKN